MVRLVVRNLLRLPVHLLVALVGLQQLRKTLVLILNFHHVYGLVAKVDFPEGSRLLLLKKLADQFVSQLKPVLRLSKGLRAVVFNRLRVPIRPRLHNFCFENAFFIKLSPELLICNCIDPDILLAKHP